MTTSTDQKSTTALAWFLLIFLSLIWGSSFILIKKALVTFSPLQVGSARIVLAFLAFLPLFLVNLRQIERSSLPWIVVVGLCGSGFPAFLFAIAQQEVASGLTGILNSLTPIFTFALAILIFGRKFSLFQLIGVVAGFLGIVFVFVYGEKTSINLPPLYGSLIILATLSYAISANTVSRFLTHISPVMISTLSFMVIGPFVLVYLLQTDFIFRISHHDQGWTSFGALLILSLIGTFAANILFFKLIQITEPVFSTSVAFLIPIVAIFWGFVDGELINLVHLIALVLILGGIYLIKFRKTSQSG